MEQFVDFSDLQSVLVFSAVTFIAIFFRYVLISLIFIGVFETILKDRYTARKLTATIRPKAQKWREIFWSFLTSLIFTFSGVFMVYMYMNNHTSLYTEVTIHDIWHIPLSIIIVLLLHETYYYFLHRWMHKPTVFRHFHKVHHDSITTSAWTAFSFHPYESILQALVIPIVIFFVPLHVGALFFLLIFMSVTATINHLEIEIYPEWLEKSGLGKFIIGATHHSHHHKYYTKNFGLYFTFYDRLLGTESDDFQSVFKEKTKL